jgi:hypothetical protein
MDRNDELDALNEESRKPLTTDQVRIAERERLLAAIPDMVKFDPEPAVEEIDLRIKLLEELPSSDWQEFKQRADDAMSSARAELARLREIAVKRDADRAVAAVYLEGRWKRKGKRRDWEYLAAGSGEEQQARAALARLLRDEAPLKRSMRWLLASLVDHRAERYQTRQFQIIARPGVARTATARNVAIARHIAENSGACGADGATKDAGQIFGVGVRQAQRAWKKYGRMFEK